MNIGNLSLTLYILVLIKVVIEIIQKLNQKETIIKSLETQNKTLSPKLVENIIIRYNRTNHSIDLSKIIYIESLSDYIKVVTIDDEKVTKERISKIINRLPSYFKRTHRSFIVNTKNISSYNKEFITLKNHQIPISRTYKADVLGYLETSTTELAR
ncbi:MAG: LytR/AlgR family response regulator transcription factor [Bacteroidia bacterium]